MQHERTIHDQDEEQGSRTVLLVEDEPAVRALLDASLARAGYRVLVASGGSEADVVLARHAGPVDVLLTDLVMPGESGRALARRLRLARPDLVIVYMSGYPGDALAPEHDGDDEEHELLLPKPFGLAQLERVLARALRG
jgi:two-component system cell cycle sensor histidine kinase/response regulator CckA